jgi:ABC-type transporter Mla subunit MlaD
MQRHEPSSIPPVQPTSEELQNTVSRLARTSEELEKKLQAEAKRQAGFQQQAQERIESLELSVKGIQLTAKATATRTEKLESTADSLKTALRIQDERADKLVEELKTQKATMTNLAGLVDDELARHRKVITNLMIDVITLNTKSERGSEVVLDPSDPDKFVRVNTTSGFFLVSLKNVEPYLDGHKVTLDIGNPTTATYKNLRMKATWGSKFDPQLARDDPSAYSKWEAGLKLKDVSVVDDVKPGAWNKITFVLAPSKPTEMGYLKLKMDFDTISLR